MLIPGEVSNLEAMLIEITFGVVFAFVFAILLDRITQPSLDILQFDDMVGHGRKFVHVLVRNKPRKLLFRETAINCQPQVTYVDADNNSTIGPFSTKWASQPNPISPAIDPQTHQFVYLPDETKIDQARREDIPAGASRTLDVALKISGDAECYVHTPMNFLTQDHRPQDHRLNGNRYRVDVVVTSENGARAQRQFILENTGTNPDGLTLRTSPAFTETSADSDALPSGLSPPPPQASGERIGEAMAAIAIIIVSPLLSAVMINAAEYLSSQVTHDTVLLSALGLPTQLFDSIMQSTDAQLMKAIAFDPGAFSFGAPPWWVSVVSTLVILVLAYLLTPRTGKSAGAQKGMFEWLSSVSKDARTFFLSFSSVSLAVILFLLGQTNRDHEALANLIQQFESQKLQFLNQLLRYREGKFLQIFLLFTFALVLSLVIISEVFRPDNPRSQQSLSTYVSSGAFLVNLSLILTLVYEVTALVFLPVRYG